MSAKDTPKTSFSPEVEKIPLFHIDKNLVYDNHALSSVLFLGAREIAWRDIQDYLLHPQMGRRMQRKAEARTVAVLKGKYLPSKNSPVLRSSLSTEAKRTPRKQIALRSSEGRPSTINRTTKQLLISVSVSTMAGAVLLFASRSPFAPSWMPANQSVLANVLASDSDQDARAAAADRVNSRQALTIAATRDIAIPVRLAATMHLNDQAQLKKIATSHDSEEVCEAAIKRLTDQEGPFQIAISDDNSMTYFSEPARQLRIAAINRIVGNEALQKIALMARDSVTGAAAAKRIDDQRILASVALTAQDGAVRAAAVRPGRARKGSRSSASITMFGERRLWAVNSQSFARNQAGTRGRN